MALTLNLSISFALKMLFVYNVCAIHSSALQTRFYHESKHCEPGQTATMGPYCFFRKAT